MANKELDKNEKLGIECWNAEPDGRLIILQRSKDFFDVMKRIVIPVTKIDRFIELLKKHSSSEGDGNSFRI